MEIVTVLCRVKKIREEDVAVLTPYSSQKAVILDKIEGKGLSGVTVQTVTESQGIHSFCHSNQEWIKCRPVKFKQ